MDIHVTAGDCLSGILSVKYPKRRFIPFREAMVEGPCRFPPFSERFLEERAGFHGCSIEDYRSHMSAFLDFLDHLDRYEEVGLWFGQEPFCEANVRVVLLALKQRGYRGTITRYVVDERNGDVLLRRLVPNGR